MTENASEKQVGGIENKYSFRNRFFKNSFNYKITSLIARTGFVQTTLSRIYLIREKWDCVFPIAMTSHVITC